MICFDGDWRLLHALQGICFHSLQITKLSPPDALRSQGLCRISRRFKDSISAVIIFDTFVICFGGNFVMRHALRGICFFHALQIIKSATLDAQRWQGLYCTSQRCNNSISTVIAFDVFLICFGGDLGLRFSVFVFTRCRQRHRRLRMLCARKGSAASLGASRTGSRQ